MGKSSPAAPAAPDPVATAAAQTKSNIDTANATANLNHTNQYTPWGSLVYTSAPNADGTSQWSSNITLSPDQQKLLDAQNGQSLALSNLGTSQLANVKDALASPINFNNAPSVKNDPLKYGVGQTAANGGPIQSQVDMSGVPKMVGGDALAGAMKDNQGAAYKQQAAYLDSSYGQRQHDLENQLVQQGVTQNSDAWNRAMSSLGEQRTFDYNNAFNNSFSTGLAANKQLYDQGLSSNQNAYGQALGNGTFANAAQAQQYGQSADTADRAFSQGMANAGLNNQTAGQAFAQSSADRARQLGEMSQKQQIPLNLLNALRTGSQVTSPQFGSTPQTNVAGTDIASLYNNQYQGQLAGMNGQIATNNANTSAGAGLASTAAMAFMMF
jgi:hypothetical protein